MSDTLIKLFSFLKEESDQTKQEKESIFVQYLPQHSSCQSTDIHFTRGHDNSADLY